MPKPKRNNRTETQTKITRHLVMDEKHQSIPGATISKSETPFTPITKNDNKRPLSSPENAETSVRKQQKPEDMIQNEETDNGVVSETVSAVAAPANEKAESSQLSSI